MLGLKRADLDIVIKEKNVKMKARLNPESRNDQEEELEMNKMSPNYWMTKP